MAQGTAAPARGAKNSSTVVILLVVVLALAGGAAGGAYFYMKQNGDAASLPPQPGITAFDPFVVNLADPGGQRFFRLTLRLVLPSKEAAAALERDEIGRMRARSSILELLTVQRAEQLVTPEGKVELKKAILARATEALQHVKVADVLFTEFVIQF